MLVARVWHTHEIQILETGTLRRFAMSVHSNFHSEDFADAMLQAFIIYSAILAYKNQLFK